MIVSKHSNGTFCWAELSTADGPAAKAFYQKLMGWSSTDNPMGEGMIYTMLSLTGENIGALYQDNSGKSPPHWETYISVDDLEATTAKVKDFGGTVLAGPFDVMEHGRMNVIQDPTGAVFCMWQPKNHIGYTLLDVPGSVCWNELSTRDVPKATQFYAGLFGYGIKQSEMPMQYTEFQLDGKSIAGMMEIGPELAGVPPHWLIYFAVENCQASADKATALGGTILLPTMPIPGVGHIAVLRDPQGAVFGIAGG